MTVKNIDKFSLLQDEDFEICIDKMTWNIVITGQYKALFLKNGSIGSDIVGSISPFVCGRESFYKQVIIGSTALLMAVFDDIKTIVFFSPRASAELFILENSSELLSDRFKGYLDKLKNLDKKLFPHPYNFITRKNNLDDFLQGDILGIENIQGDILEELKFKMKKYQPSVMEYISDFILKLTTDYLLIRIHLLKFIVVLPTFDGDKSGVSLKKMLVESLELLIKDSKKLRKHRLPFYLYYFFIISNFIVKLIPSYFLKKIINTSVCFVAKRFIAGENIDDAKESLLGLIKSGRQYSLDQLGELVVSKSEASSYHQKVISLIYGLKAQKVSGKNPAGINNAHISIKVSALCYDFKPYAYEDTYNKIRPLLFDILKVAKENEVFINIDAEHYHYRDIVFYVYQRLLLEQESLSDFKDTGIVVQAYLIDAYEHLIEVENLARKREIIMPIRLVKGAYWDEEVIEAYAHGHTPFEFLNKEETDLHFRQLIKKVMDSPYLHLCLASHNIADHCFAEAIYLKNYKGTMLIEHQCLHMTCESLSMAMARSGWVVRNYIPIGGLLVGMAYLVRRIMENSSQLGVLSAMRDNIANSLLSISDSFLKNKKDGKLNLCPSTGLSSEFVNIPPVYLFINSQRDFVEKALFNFKSDLKKHYENTFKTSGEVKSIYSNSDNEILVGTFKVADKKDVDNAISLVDNGFIFWSKTPFNIRSSILIMAANLFMVKRNYLASLIVYEAGKSVVEALADVDEAIDFLNFYARENIKYKDRYPRGVVAVIPPWNFPLAIPCGMVAAALVSGNTVVLKPATQTPLIAQVMVDILYESGIPKNALVNLPGRGFDVGESLVNHPKVAFVVFTGSKKIGLNIFKKAEKRMYQNEILNIKYPVKVITEMGGKNAIVITSTSDIDQAIAGVLYSSFAHAGQKCSAASRVLVDSKIADHFISRLKLAVEDLKVAPAFDLSCTINPVINKKERDRLKEDIRDAILEAKDYDGIVHVNRSNEQLPGSCLGPVLIELPIERFFIDESYSQRELFGPILHIAKFYSDAQAVDAINSVEYALTAGIFGQSNRDIEFFSKLIKAGNIYINRSITGARVAIEPFGGFKMSGTGPKAGGIDYLNAFYIGSIKEQKRTIIDREKSRDDDYEFIKFSNNSYFILRIKAIKLIDKVSSQLYLYNPPIQLSSFSSWLNYNFLSFISGRKNKYIPGQINYDNFNLKAKRLVFISASENVDINILLQIIAAMIMDVSVVVVCNNIESYNWWSLFYSILISEDLRIFKNFNKPLFATDKLYNKVLIDHQFDTIVIDGDNDCILDCLKLIKESDERYSMRKVLTSYDYKDNSFEYLFLNILNIRSFAINTIRYGAILEVENL